MGVSRELVHLLGGHHSRGCQTTQRDREAVVVGRAQVFAVYASPYLWRRHCTVAQIEGLLAFKRTPLRQKWTHHPAYVKGRSTT